MDPITGGLLIGGANLLGSVFGTTQNNQNAAEIAAQTNAASMARQTDAENFNREMVSQQENFQQTMSNSAYQRASADMMKAGLNPSAMFGSGSAASTPSGSSASISAAPVVSPTRQSPLSGIGPAMQNAIQSATALRTADATVDNLVAENARLKADTKLKGAEEFSTYMGGHLRSAETENVRASLPKILNEALTAKNQQDMNPQLRRILDQAGFAGRQVSETLSPVANLVSSARQVGLMTGKGY